MWLIDNTHVYLIDVSGVGRRVILGDFSDNLVKKRDKNILITELNEDLQFHMASYYMHVFQLLLLAHK